ncbi:hypothetical protein G6F68_015626 [Rhizopus microsporus]|nr:hypothetical protein G6F68_015626 [Rhizopus microsporus]
MENKIQQHQLVKRYDCGDIRPVEWLDNLAFRQIEKIHKEASANLTELALYVDLPKFDFPVVYGEMEYELPDPFIEDASITEQQQLSKPSTVDWSEATVVVHWIVI